MGYTHYFPQQRAFTDFEWSMITKAFKKLAASEQGQSLIAPETSCGWSDFFTHKDLKIKGDAIAFNGIGNGGCETFLIEKNPADMGEFNCCKTNDHPYDVMVVATLIVCAGYAEGALRISSDGEEKDWQEGVELVTSVLGKSTKIEFVPGPEDTCLRVSTPSPEEVAELAQKMEFKKSMSNEKPKPQGKLSLVKDNNSPTP